MKEQTIALMKELTQVIGISGDEKDVSKILLKYYKPLCDEVVYDNLGSIFAVKKSKKENAPKVMICGHMDEVGFLINGIKDNGLLSFLVIGGIDGESMYASRVRVKTSSAEYTGVIVADNDDISSCDAKKMFIDLGTSSKEETLNLGVRLGDSAVLDGPFTVLANERILSKAWDDRYGCVMSVEILEALQGIELDVDLYIGATVMEEVGMRGATTATGLIHPDMGIVLDCSFASDVLGKENAVGQLGKGVLVRYYDKGMMPNRALLQHLVDTCVEHQLPYQYFYNMGNTDAAWIHKWFSGCPTLTACICGRNVHTGNTLIDMRDYNAAKTAVIEIIKELNADKIKTFKEENR